MYSRLEDEKQWTACCECNRGGNGAAKDKCSSGWQSKTWDKLGCFLGQPANHITHKPVYEDARTKKQNPAHAGTKK